MKQAILISPEKFEFREVEIPQVKAGEALIKVRSVGICGSDIHAYYGRHPFISCPIVMGHEATGEIVEVADGVKNIKKGDRVVMRPQKICGECLLCRTNRYNICKKLEVIGCQCTGACSDYFAVDAGILYKLPDNVEYDVGTVIEPLAVGVHAAKRGIDGSLAGKKLVVSGAGTIGNVVAQAAKGLGADKVMITDISDYKLELAKKCGIDYAVNVAKTDLGEAIAKEYGEDGADAMYECTASAAALNSILEVARKGSTIVIVGVFSNKTTMNMANVQDREYQLRGSLMYTHEDYLDAIDLVKEGKVDLKTLISKEFALTDIAKAYKYIEDNRDTVQKVILNV